VLDGNGIGVLKPEVYLPGFDRFHSESSILTVWDGLKSVRWHKWYRQKGEA
jgi:hypothetical protein